MREHNLFQILHEIHDLYGTSVDYTSVQFDSSNRISSLQR